VVVDSVTNLNTQSGITAADNTNHGMVIRGCGSLGNGAAGILVYNYSTVTDNSTSFNGAVGIQSTNGSNISRNSVGLNAVGIQPGPGSGYGENIVWGNTMDIGGAGGTSLGNNLCGGAAC